MSPIAILYAVIPILLGIGVYKVLKNIKPEAKAQPLLPESKENPPLDNHKVIKMDFVREYPEVTSHTN